MKCMTSLSSVAVATLIAAVTGTACTQASPEQQIVNDAAAALGGRDKILAVKTLVIEGGGTNGNLGQDMSPDAIGQAFDGDGLQTGDGRRGRTRSDRTNPHAELHLFPGPAAAKTGARR